MTNVIQKHKKGLLQNSRFATVPVRFVLPFIHRTKLQFIEMLSQIDKHKTNYSLAKAYASAFCSLFSLFFFFFVLIFFVIYVLCLYAIFRMWIIH